MKTNPLLDVDFLKELTENRSRTVYARVIALNMKEEVIEEIGGRVTQGSITIDGTSSVRRSCSMTLVATEMDINDYYWGLNTKVQIYIGLKNEVNKNYDDIIWFNQGIFILSSFSTSQSANSYNINLQGKDKMSMLNGDLGGVVKSLTADFGKLTTYETDANGRSVIAYEDIPVKTIIREAVHKYGNEPYHNIIINDIDDYGIELMEYRGDENSPLYFIINNESGEVENMTLDGSQTYYQYPNGNLVRLDSIPVYDNRIEKDFGYRDTVTRVYDTDINNLYTIEKIEYGETCGYRLTDLTYPGDLIAQVGEPITTGVLDKIVKMLGNFEYFYDVDGKFIFQKKKTYIDTSWNNIQNASTVDSFREVLVTASNYRPNEYYIYENGQYILAKSSTYHSDIKYYEFVDGEYATSAIETSPISYYFGGGNLVTSFQNAPDYTKLKNDFSIWGEKKSGTSDTTIPIHMRYAIDQKPYYYKTFPRGEDNEETQYIYTTLNQMEYEIMMSDKYETPYDGYYVKTQNPTGLSEDWWDISDWANYYQRCTGKLPEGRIGSYCTSDGVKMNGVFEKIEFVLGVKSIPGNVNGWDAYERMAINVFDVEADGKVGYTGHGPNCSHDYSYFLNRAGRNDGTSYIYKPRLPEETETIATIPIIKNEIKYNMDWRELIYQMAIDYNAHHNEDDYMINLMKYNKGFVHENGMTGYETYYTDIEGFWRTLYNPDTAPNADPPNDALAQYYRWDSELEKYISVPFEDLVTIKDVPRDYDFYQKRGDTFYRLAHSTDGDFYTKERIIDLTNLTDEKQYYILSNGEYVKYNNDTFSIGRAYYEYMGYRRVNILEKGKEYYKRTGENGNYEYPESTRVYFSEDTDYYHKDTGVASLYIKTQSFARGNTYYTYTDGTYDEIFDYSEDDVYYERLGYQLVLDLTDCTAADSYVLDDTLLVTPPFEIGLAYDFYKLQTNLENKKYYRWNSNRETFELIQVLCSFELGKQYYIEEDDEITYYNIYDWKDTSDILYVNPDYNINTGWITDVTEDPANLIFWFDFLDTGGDVSKYSVSAVGDRSRAINDADVKAIYYRDIPNVIFVNADNWETERDVKSGFTYVKITPQLENLFTISAQGKSAQDELEQFLYDYTYCTEQITVAAVPVYHLQPNTRIAIRDDNSNINGEYLVTRLSMPLAYNGTMSITATKAVDRLY